MNVEDFMKKHGLTDESLDREAEQYERGDFEAGVGPVYVGSHYDAVGTKRVSVIYPAEDARKVESLAKARGCNSSDIYRQALAQYLQTA